MMAVFRYVRDCSAGECKWATWRREKSSGYTDTTADKQVGRETKTTLTHPRPGERVPAPLVVVVAVKPARKKWGG